MKRISLKEMKKKYIFLALILTVCSFFVSFLGIPIAKENSKSSNQIVCAGEAQDVSFLKKDSGFKASSMVTDNKEYTYKLNTIVNAKENSILDFEVTDISDLPTNILEKDIIVTAKYGQHAKREFNLLYFLGRYNRNYAKNPITTVLYKGKLKDIPKMSIDLKETQKYYMTISIDIQNARSFQFSDLNARFILNGEKINEPFFSKLETKVFIVNIISMILACIYTIKADDKVKANRGKKLIIAAFTIPLIVIGTIIAFDLLMSVLMEGVAIVIVAIIDLVIISAAALFTF